MNFAAYNIAFNCREKLNKKESELHDLQVNMNHWKDLTAQRLAEKFQEELQLQVDRYESRNATNFNAAVMGKFCPRKLMTGKNLVCDHCPVFVTQSRS